jgi:hypothetical protein
MEIEYKIIYQKTPNDEPNPDAGYYTDLLQKYNYNSAVILNSSTKYSECAQENIINIISEHSGLIITGNCLLKLDNIPTNVKMIYITTSMNYEHPLHNLPSELEHLTIDTTYYNNTLDYLPASLKTLFLYGSSNIPLNNLPSGLLELSVGGRYNEPLDNLPRNLKVLILSEFYQKQLVNLPPGLKELYIGSDYYLPITNLPDSIEDLTISGNPQYIELPSNLKTFSIGFESSYFVELVDSIEEINLNVLSLKILYNLLVHYCPLNLKTIKIQPLIDNDDSISKLRKFEQDIIDEIKYNCPDIDIQINKN